MPMCVFKLHLWRKIQCVLLGYSTCKPVTACTCDMSYNFNMETHSCLKCDWLCVWWVSTTLQSFLKLMFMWLSIRPYNYVFEADFTNRTEKKCNVVHVIPCHSCPELCIGQTSANCRWHNIVEQTSFWFEDWWQCMEHLTKWKMACIFRVKPESFLKLWLCVFNWKKELRLTEQRGLGLWGWECMEYGKWHVFSEASDWVFQLSRINLQKLDYVVLEEVPGNLTRLWVIGCCRNTGLGVLVMRGGLSRVVQVPLHTPDTGSPNEGS